MSKKKEPPICLLLFLVLMWLGFSSSEETIYGKRPSEQTVTELHQDDRPDIIRAYLEDYGSPYYTASQDIVVIGDKHGISPYLLTAIFIQESSGGKQCIANNCMGWGVCGGSYIPFDTVLSGVEVVAENLSTNDLYQGKSSWHKMRVYNGPEYADKILWLSEVIQTYE